MKLSPLAQLALAIMPLRHRKLVSDTFPVDLNITCMVEILIWEANKSFKLEKDGICVSQL